MTRDRLVEGALLSATAATVGALGSVVAVVTWQGGRALLGLGSLAPAALAGARWGGGDLGLLAPLAGTLLVTSAAMGLCLPFGYAGAVWLAFFAPPGWREPVRTAIGALAGIPSVVFGFAGVVWLASLLAAAFGLPDGRVALTGAVLVGLMAWPTVVVRSEAALREVPEVQLDSAIALGATRLRGVTSVVVPAAWRGLAMAGMLGGVRALGDTMVVLMATGSAARPGGLLAPARTLTETVAAELPHAGAARRDALFVIGLLVLVVTFGLHVAATRRTGVLR